MIISPADLAFMKGEAAARKLEASEDPRDLAARYGYHVPGAQLNAFVAGCRFANQTAEDDSGHPAGKGNPRDV